MLIKKIKIFTIVVSFVVLALDQITNANISAEMLAGDWWLIAISRHPTETSAVMECGRMVITQVGNETIKTRNINVRDGTKYIYDTTSIIFGSEVQIITTHDPYLLDTIPRYYIVSTYNRDEELIWVDRNSTQIHKLYSRRVSASKKIKEAFNNYVTQRGFRVEYIKNFNC